MSPLRRHLRKWDRYYDNTAIFHTFPNPSALFIAHSPISFIWTSSLQSCASGCHKSVRFWNLSLTLFFFQRRFALVTCIFFWMSKNHIFCISFWEVLSSESYSCFGYWSENNLRNASFHLSSNSFFTSEIR